MRLFALATVTVALSFSLQPLAAQEAVEPIEPIVLEGFVITAAPVPRPLNAIASNVTLLEGQELETRGVTRVSDALREVPGLVVVQGGSFGGQTSVFFRGGESDYVKVLVDGVEVNQAGGAFDFSGLVLEDVERIEVVRGPSSALFGSDAVAGVIQIITRRGRTGTRASAFVQGGSFGRLDWAVKADGGGERTDYAFSLNRSQGDGILEFNNGFRNTILTGSVRHRPDERTSVQINGRYADRVFHFPTDGSGNLVDENQFTYGTEANLAMQVSRVVTDRLQLQLRGSVYDYSGGSDDRPDGPGDNTGFFGFVSLDDFQRAQADLRANLYLDGGLTLTAGGDVESQSQRSFNESLSEFGNSASEASYDRFNGAGYAHALLDRGPLSANLGFRFEDNEQYGNFFTYQAGARYALKGTGTALRGSVGTSFKEPTFLEAFSDAPFALGDPDLQPEESFAWEVGLDQPLGERFSLGLTWFDQNYENLIQYTAVVNPGQPNYVNLAEAASRGLELDARGELGPVNLSLAWTYLDTEVLDAGADSGEGATFVEGEALIRRPEQQVAVVGTWNLGPHTLSADIRHVGSRADRNFSSFPATPVELDAYTLLNAGAVFRLFEGQGRRPGTELTLRAENLLDEDYQEIFGFRAPGRGVYVGVRLGW